MSGFSVVRRGYNAKEVDEYIAKNKSYLEDKLKEQKLRINELKIQNLKLAAIIKEMRAREDDVKNALIAANEKAKEIMSAAKLKYALEGQRLRLLQVKWTNHFESLGNKEICDDYKPMQAYYIGIEAELQSILKNDFGITVEKAETSIHDDILSQYKSETKRLFDGDDGKNVYGEIIKKIKKEFGGEFSAGVIDELDDILELDDDDVSDYEFPETSLCTEPEREIESRSADTMGEGRLPDVFRSDRAETMKQPLSGSYPVSQTRSASGRTPIDKAAADLANLAAVTPDMSLEELCKELGL
ncbi:MAG: DivIVA domain-containing protein [Clostridiales bacterium]|jgi:cell division septum initiation protein DivIVA|nr:DivIVA domain-containing protein [Clostridiales bacterium]